jgi:signal transduction histidine kinase
MRREASCHPTRIRGLREETLLKQSPTDPAEELAQLRKRVLALESELRARDEFIVAAAHELRNPVSPLVMHVHRLLTVARANAQGSVSPAWLAEQLELFSRRLTRFMAALNRLLDVSRIQSGHVELLDEPVDLVEVAREVMVNFERELAASKCALNFEAPPALIGCWDRLRLEQIINNLVSNAIRYGDSSPITVSIEAHGEAAILRVADRGIGISAEDQARIFARFERAHTENRAGFGVGLWVVDQLCTAMGGSVIVQSRPGAGSVFTVTLPTTRNERLDVR